MVSTIIILLKKHIECLILKTNVIVKNAFEILEIKFEYVKKTANVYYCKFDIDKFIVKNFIHIRKWI